VFAAFAAVLALVGIYGVIAYTVRLREREIAVRLAMGADGGTITRMFVKQGAIVLTAGLIVGVAGAVALGRVLRAQLFGVQAVDPSVIATMVLTFAICGLLAVAWPARAAASTDPASALKK
jgi:ABC-type antimicrobial peptide transport system permease subunit